MDLINFEAKRNLLQKLILVRLEAKRNLLR